MDKKPEEDDTIGVYLLLSSQEPCYHESCSGQVDGVVEKASGEGQACSN